LGGLCAYTDKVIYNDYKNLEYKIIPIEIHNKIQRLVFQSFTASGKAVNNQYYYNEWAVLKDLSGSEDYESKIDSTSNIEKHIIQTKEVQLPAKVKSNSSIIIRYQKTGVEIKIKLVDYPTKYESSSNIQKIYNKSPLGVAVVGKTVGESFPVGSEDNVIEIIEVSD